jgi:hypothetical protein
MALRPYYLGGRLRGYRDENGRPVTIQEGQRAGLVPLAEAPMVRQDPKTGRTVLSGGTDQALSDLTGMLKAGFAEVVSAPEPKKFPILMPPKTEEPQVPNIHKPRSPRSDKGKPRAVKK